MSAAERVRTLLERKRVSYQLVEHPEALTARAEAEASAMPAGAWAKSLAVRLDGTPAVVVLPATRRLDLKELGELAGAREVELVAEDELAELYPDCDVGALPPFGGLFGQRTYLDLSLRTHERVAFHAGNHTQTVVVPYAEFERLAGAEVGRFSREADDV